MSPAPDGPLVKEVWIDAPREVVFGFITEADKVAQWSGVSARMEVEPGGLSEITYDTQNILRGQFVEIAPPDRLVYECGFTQGEGSVMPGGMVRVEMILTARDGGTMLRVVNYDVPDSFRESADGGWEHYLGRLAVAASGGSPGPDMMFENSQGGR